MNVDSKWYSILTAKFRHNFYKEVSHFDIKPVHEMERIF